MNKNYELNECIINLIMIVFRKELSGSQNRRNLKT